jgi:release factor glutamine methyltransferase
MRIPSNQYLAVMNFALKELKDSYPPEEIKSLMYWLFEEYLDVSKTQYILNPKKGMSESELLQFNFAIKDLKKGKPIQYILGHTYFQGLKIKVNEHTLIPRPETEELVNIVLEVTGELKAPLKILDMCCGTGCIALALKSQMPQNEYFGADYIPEIIALATSNAKQLQLDVTFFLYNLLQDHKKNDQLFDVIVSNPPYVLESDKTMMHKNVLNYEPSSALYVPDKNALIYYDQILKYAECHLKPGGMIFFEIHENKSTEIEFLFLNYNYNHLQIKSDFRGKNRFAIAKKQPK